MLLPCHISRAFKFGKPREQDGREGKGQPDHQLRDEEISQLAVVGWGLDGAGGLVFYFPRYDKDLI